MSSSEGSTIVDAMEVDPPPSSTQINISDTNIPSTYLIHTETPSYNDGTTTTYIDPSFYATYEGNWCRYCGARTSSGWSRGPWGSRKLCIIHYVRWHQKKNLKLTQWSSIEPTTPIAPGENTEFKYLARIESKRAASIAYQAKQLEEQQEQEDIQKNTLQAPSSSTSSSSSSSSNSQGSDNNVEDNDTNEDNENPLIIPDNVVSISVYANADSGISDHLRERIITTAGQHVIKPTVNQHKVRDVCCKTMAKEFGYMHTTGRRAQDFALYKPNTQTEKRIRGEMVAKSLKQLLLYLAKKEYDLIYKRVIEIIPEFEKLMLWQLERHRMDSGKIRYARADPASNDPSTWLVASRVGRARKKTKSFAEQSSEKFYALEIEKELVKAKNRKVKKEREKLEREVEKEKKKLERDFQSRLNHEKRLAARKLRALRKSARRAATWGGKLKKKHFILNIPLEIKTKFVVRSIEFFIAFSKPLSFCNSKIKKNL